MASVYDLLNGQHDPVTGKVTRTGQLSGKQIEHLLSTDGLAVWDKLLDEEKAVFAIYIRERFIDARNSMEKDALNYYSEILIRVNTGQQPAHGEYS